MKHFIKSDRPYTQTKECFSKFKGKMRCKENLNEKIQNKEYIVNQYYNTIQLLGTNKIFDEYPFEIQKKEKEEETKEEEKKVFHIKQTKSEFGKQKTMQLTPLFFKQNKLHQHKSSYYNSCQTLCSTLSNKKTTLKLQYSNKKQQYQDGVFITESDNVKYQQNDNRRLHTASDFHQKSISNRRKISKIPILSLTQMKFKFPKRRFESIYDDFNSCNIRANPLTERLRNPKDEVPYFNQKKKKNIFENIETEVPAQKSRNIATVYSKTTKMFSIIDKANADLMNFGDNYLKINDEQFYLRQKEIMRNYQYIRHNANIETDLPEEKSDRLKKFKINQFKIARAYRTMTYEHSKFMAILDSLQDKDDQKQT